MPRTVNRYRLYCVTDQKFEYVWGKVAPTMCPTDSSHQVDLTRTSIVDKIKKREIKIQEETVPTGGNFCCKIIKVDAAANTTTHTDTIFSMPITAMSINFVTKDEHEGDEIDLCIGPDTPVGYLTSNLSIASEWTSQSYTVGDVVVYNQKLYTCILDTVSDEPVSDQLYWTRGYRLQVSETATAVLIGYYVTLNDGTENVEMGRVISVDKTNNYIYVENNTPFAFQAASPSIILANVYPIKGHEIGPASVYNIGGSKIGGSYIPADTVIRVKYLNKDPTQAKKIIGRVDYLY